MKTPLAHLSACNQLDSISGCFTIITALKCMQGFQLLVEDLSGFGSIAAKAAERLQEDFPKCTSLAFPIRLANTSEVNCPSVKHEYVSTA